MFDLEFSLIAAIDEERGIGRDGRIPWYYPEDLRRFARLTKDNIVVMGTNTWRSLRRDGKKLGYLPGRINVVVTRDITAVAMMEWQKQSPEALQYSLLYSRIEPEDIARLVTSFVRNPDGSLKKVFYIGGAQIYEQLIGHPKISRLYLTKVPGTHGCDRFFPEWEDKGYELGESWVSHTPHRLVYSVYEKSNASSAG